jgi:SAM-dependent methyltransferase
MFCRIFRANELGNYAEEVGLMQKYAPEIVAIKYQNSLYQHAAMLHYVLAAATKEMEILCVGSNGDVPAEVLKKMGYTVIGIDPSINVDLATYKKQFPDKRFDLIFSTSVIEHVEDDKQFVLDMAYFLKPGSLCLVTCDFKADFKPGDYKFADQFRLYTEKSLHELATLVCNEGCMLTDTPQWGLTPADMDFELAGLQYSAVGIAFKKQLGP